MVSVLTDPLVWVLEAIGLAYLVILAGRARLLDPVARSRFLATGTVDVPIDRSG